jgi:phosphatidylserine decarboxylase
MGWAVAAWIVGLLTFYIAAFFRDPPRSAAQSGDHQVVSPADGRVTVVEEIERPEFPGGRCLRIGVFLSVLDVHINRMPLAGEVERTERTPGRFMNAMKPESAVLNERQDIWLKTRFGPVLVRQIAGLIARRIICRAQRGDAYERGERFGLIRFGSGTEVYLPLPAKPLVKPREFVRCGKTIIAEMGAEASPTEKAKLRSGEDRMEEGESPGVEIG